MNYHGSLRLTGDLTSCTAEFLTAAAANISAALGDVTADVEVSCAPGNFVLHHLVRFGSDYAPANAAAALLDLGAADTAAEWLPAVEAVDAVPAVVPLPPPSIPSPAPGSPYVAAAAPPSAPPLEGPPIANLAMLAFLSLLLLVPLLWWLYATSRYPGRVSLYFQDKFTHSNPHVAVGYRSKESRRKTKLLLTSAFEIDPEEEPAGADCDNPILAADPARRPSVQPPAFSPRAAAAGSAPPPPRKKSTRKGVSWMASVTEARASQEAEAEPSEVGLRNSATSRSNKPPPGLPPAGAPSAAGSVRAIGEIAALGSIRVLPDQGNGSGDGGGIDVEESITFECPRPKSRSSREPSKKSGLSMADAADHFARADTDGDGVITQKELAAYATEVAEEARRSEMMADDDDVEGGARRRSGSPSWPAAMREASTVQLPAALVSAISSNMTRLLQLFAVWDTDGDGTISPREFERALLQLSIQTQPADRSKLFRLIDADGSGDIRVEELIALKVAIEGARRDKARRRTVALCEAKAAGADAATLAEMSRAMTQSSSHSFIKDSGLGELTESIGGRRVVVQGDTGEKIKGACSTLRNLLVKPMLGALWKQPLQPHHALSLEPDWHEMADEAFDVHGKHHFHYEPGLVPSVREHVLKCQAGLQEGCSQATHELGELLLEVRQADLKLQEVRLSQRLEARNADDVVARFSMYLQYCAADLERSLIMIERYALPLDVCADSLFKAGQIKGDAAKSAKSGRPFTPNARAAEIVYLNNELSRRESVEEAPPADGMVAVSAAGGRASPASAGAPATPRHDRTKAYAEYAHAAHGLSGAPIARWLDKFAPLPGQVAKLRRVSHAFITLVAAYLILFVAVELAAGFHAVELGVPGQRMTLCELTHYTDRCNASAAPDTFEGGERFLRQEVSIFRASSLQCTAAADELARALETIGVNSTLALDDIVSMDERRSGAGWADLVGMAQANWAAGCGLSARTSWLYLLPLPLDLAISIWPMRMWTHNMHSKGVRKVLLWTPTVPLVLLQLFVRALILCTVVGDSFDTMLAVRKAIEGFSLLLQCGVFLFMDAQKVTAPKMRFVFAFILILRFLWSFFTRQAGVIWTEQYPVLPQSGRTLGYGTTARQSMLASVDWTVITLMANSLISVLLHPTELAVVRIRADVQGYLNWRDHYIKKMALQAARRDQDIADAFLYYKSRITHYFSAEEKQARRASLAIGKAKAPEVQPTVSQESVRPPSKGRSSIGLRI